jgi:hypothetical protein
MSQNLYSNEDKKKGYIFAKDRFNVERNFDLLSVSAAIIEINLDSNITDFDSILNKVKKLSKESPCPIYQLL